MGFREKEMEWRGAHTEVLKAFEGEWVVLEGEQIVTHGKDPLDVVAEARAGGIPIPYIFYVEPAQDKETI